MRRYVVGGAVRDVLLGLKPQDMDFVWVGATPQDLLDQGMKRVGSEFPVFLDSDGNEHALARTERKTGAGYYGFDCTFDPTVTLEDDQLRRDVTINQLAVAFDDWDQFVHTANTKFVVDASTGLNDLRNGVLRHASSFFSDDPLRVLRTARFVARYDFTVAPETMNLMRQLVDSGELDHLVAERVWTELEKAMMEDHPAKFFWTLRQCDAMRVLFEELDPHLVSVGAVVTQAAMRRATFNQRMMLLMSRTSTVCTNQMFDRLRAPNDVVRLCDKMRTMLDLLEDGHAHHGWDADANQALQTLHDVDAFRREDDLFDVVRALGFFRDSELHRRLDRLLRGFNNARWACFATLTEHEKNTLQGRQIGQAIDQQRLQALQNEL